MTANTGEMGIFVSGILVSFYLLTSYSNTGIIFSTASVSKSDPDGDSGDAAFVAFLPSRAMWSAMFDGD